MSHTVGEKAAMAVENSKRPTLKETRTDEQRIRDIRKNLANNLWVMPDDIRLLLNLYDAAVLEIADAEKDTRSRLIDLACEVSDLRALNHQLRDENDQFRNVYEAENRTQTVTVEQFVPQPGEVLQPLNVDQAPAPAADLDAHRMDDDGAAVAHPDAPVPAAVPDDDIPF